MNSQLHHLEIITTADGSPSLFDKDLKASYHSKFGALQESKHIFIKHGLEFAFKKFNGNISIFETGFGTGLNAILSAIEASEHKQKIQYTSIEKFPLQKEIYDALQFEKLFSIEKQNAVDQILNCSWNQWHKVSNHFEIKKVDADILNYTLDSKYHLIYFDAFSPEINPEIWQKNILEMVYQSMLPGAILVSFCAKGSFKRLLKEIGFIVETLPGPIGKREITRATKI